MYATLKPLATRRNLLIALLIVILINTVAFPSLSGRLGEAGPIDLRFSYTPVEVFSMVESYGPEGRAEYALGAVTLDLLYPLVYTFFFASVIIALGMRVFPEGSPGHKLFWLPILMMLADFGENTGIVALLTRYPDPSTAIAQAANLFTMAKWGFFTLTLLAVIGLLVLMVRQRGKAK